MSTPTVAESLVQSLVDAGVTQVFGVVGDALNPVTDAIRRREDIEWIGVRHEETAAFAAGAQAQLTGRIGVCMGTVGPGAIHLLNGLYDAKKSHAPVLAIAGQVPSPEMGTDYFQEVDNDVLFRDVAAFSRTLTSPEQMPLLLEQAVNTAYARRGVSVVTVPGDVGSLKMPKGAGPARTVPADAPAPPPQAQLLAAAQALADPDAKVTLLVGCGAREAREEVLAFAEALAAPMVLTLKAKEALEQDNRFQIGQSGLIGNPSTDTAFGQTDVLVMVGTDFPYRDFYPKDAVVVQIDRDGAHLGRRTRLDVGVVGDAAATLSALLPLVPRHTDTAHLQKCRGEYEQWLSRQQALTDPDHDDGILGRVRAALTNPEDRIRPELVADAVHRHAPADTVFTSDTGMSTVWLARFVHFHGTRRLLGSYNLGSMANAMPQAIGAQALDRTRPVAAFCGDGGLTMLLGDLRTAVTHRLPIRFVVFDNARLGMVKLEQEQGGLPEFGTELDNPDLAAVATAMGLAARRVTDPEDVDEAVAWAFAQPGPILLDMVTSAEEVALPPHAKVAQGWGFAIAKSTEFLESKR